MYVINEKMKTRVMEVSPDLATRWLAKRPERQRNLRRGLVARYKQRMLLKQWKLVPEPISFNTNGELINGQHRLTAQVESGLTLQYNVSFDVEGDYDLPMDQGAIRTAEDRWGLPRGLSGIVRIVGALESGHPSLKIDQEELPLVYDRNKRTLDWVHETFYTTKRTVMLAPVLGAVVFALPIDKDKIMNFAQSVHTGELLVSGEPAYALRNWIQQNQGHGGGQYKVALATCQCLRSLLKNETLTKIHITPGGYEFLCQRRRAKRVPNTPAYSSEND